MRFIYSFILLLISGFVFNSCEVILDEEDLPSGGDKIVVEGSIDEDFVPLVFLTRNVPFFGTLNFGDLENFFVHDAVVTISDGEKTIVLEELVVDTLDQLASVYTVPLDELLMGNFENVIFGEAGKSYSIQVQAEGRNLTAETYIPNSLPIDSIWSIPQTIGDNDSLTRAFVQITDPDTLGNYYRYFTQRNSEPMWPAFNSVFDDLIINGKQFPTFVDRAVNRLNEDDIDFETFGFFELGDTITIRMSAISETTYNFWNTLEANSQSGGPFSGITIVDGNIEGEGGFGIWGGYGVREISMVIPKE